MREHTQDILNIKDYSFPGQFLKAVRESQGLSQRAAAIKAGMSPSALCRLEAGKRVFPRNYIELTDVYGVDPRDLKKLLPKKKALSGLEIMKQNFPGNWKSILQDCLKEII